MVRREQGAGDSLVRPAFPPIRPTRRWRRLRLALTRGALLAPGLAFLWFSACVVEWYSERRLLPWNPYGACGVSAPAALPETVRVGLYEEFPNPWRLAKLQQVDFPVTLAIAANSREEFLGLRDSILSDYPQVREVYFWPLLAREEGYYPGTWSNASAVQRVAAEAEGMPVLWDLEMPRDLRRSSLRSWLQNRTFLDRWLRTREQPVHLWRSHDTMGLNPLFLRMMGMHFDPLTYSSVLLHLDLYANGRVLPSEQMARVMRCGVERYGERFIPSLGVLNDGQGPDAFFATPDVLRRDLYLARQAGAAEVWIFGVNGLNDEYLSAIRETLPLESVTEY